MGSNVVMSSFPAAGIRPCAAAPGGGGRLSPARAAGGSWWTPLFGWPAEPDYIDGETVAKEDQVEEGRKPAAAGRRFSGLTEEKAKELRMRTMETETFHDVMYHSAIASRLASDLPRRPHH